MAARLPASQRTREELTALIEGRLSTASAKDELVKFASRLIVEEALEGEAGDALGRDYYEHGAEQGQGYRNGYRTGRLKTAEGLMEYSAPQIAGREEPFHSAIREHLKGHTQGLEDLAIEMLARGLSVRDIEDAFKDENGRLLLSRTAVSQLGDDRRPSRPAAYDGGLQRRYRDGDRVLRGHEEAWLERSAPGDLGWRSGHHQSDRDLLSTRGAAAVPGPSHAQPGGQSAGRRLAGFQGPRAGGLPGAEPSDCPRARSRRRCRLWPKVRQRGRLLHGRLRSLHRPPAIPGHASTGHPDHELTRTPLCRGTPSSQDYSQCVRRESRLEADVRRAHSSRREMALDQGHRVRTPADHCCEKRTRSGIRGCGRPCCKAFKG